MSVNVWFGGLVMCLCVAGIHTQSAAQTQVGAAENVENIVEGDQGGTVRRLSPRSNVVQDETISTKAESAAGLRFLDQTTLSMGSNSKVTLDRFVYNPNSKTSDIVFNATRGAFRFVTGVAESSSYRFVTPTAAVGVRGTEFDLYVNDTGDTMILGRVGQVIACPRSETNIEPNNPLCCNMPIDDRPNYGIILRGDFQCKGPVIWRGKNPFTLLKEARSGDDRDHDDNDRPKKSSGPGRNDAPPPKDPVKNEPKDDPDDDDDPEEDNSGPKGDFDGPNRHGLNVSIGE